MVAVVSITTRHLRHFADGLAKPRTGKAGWDSRRLMRTNKEHEVNGDASSRHPSDTPHFPEPARQSGPGVAAIDAAIELAEGRGQKQQIGISRVCGQEIG